MDIADMTIDTCSHSLLPYSGPVRHRLASVLGPAPNALRRVSIVIGWPAGRSLLPSRHPAGHSPPPMARVIPRTERRGGGAFRLPITSLAARLPSRSVEPRRGGRLGQRAEWGEDRPPFRTVYIKDLSRSLLLSPPSIIRTLPPILGIHSLA